MRGQSACSATIRERRNKRVISNYSEYIKLKIIDNFHSLLNFMMPTIISEPTIKTTFLNSKFLTISILRLLFPHLLLSLFFIASSLHYTYQFIQFPQLALPLHATVPKLFALFLQAIVLTCIFLFYVNLLSQ